MPTPDQMIHAILDDNFRRHPQPVSLEHVSRLTRLDVADVLPSVRRQADAGRIEPITVAEPPYIVGVTRTF
jgi:hypothetical protein